ncbi:uncharacterized protein [Aegilops tauschii subsp. strangulata]|uniref:uncharacterized protein n=1 Tax=Aegilops tauschii subsp. strangulata TaxID=200361 RepID=UPI00098A4C05|nr:ethylene-responsive transcription factor RAP2-3-like [Aegilops tauschii subsp. strangulata]
MRRSPLFLFHCHARLHRSSAPRPTRHATASVASAATRATAPAPRHRRATMPPRRRGASGYLGVRQRPNGGFYSEIRSGQLRLGLGTFETAHEAARAYDVAAWRLGRPRPQMNFDDVHTLQQALDVAPPPRLRTAQDRAEHAERQRRLLVAHEDERTMVEWRRRHPEDVTYEQAYCWGT